MAPSGGKRPAGTLGYSPHPRSDGGRQPAINARHGTRHVPTSESLGCLCSPTRQFRAKGTVAHADFVKHSRSVTNAVASTGETSRTWRCAKSVNQIWNGPSRVYSRVGTGQLDVYSIYRTPPRWIVTIQNNGCGSSSRGWPTCQDQQKVTSESYTCPNALGIRDWVPPAIRATSCLRLVQFVPAGSRLGVPNRTSPCRANCHNV